MPRLRSRGRLIVWTLLALLALAALLVAVALWEVHRSVPALDGRAQVPGLRAPVTIARDALGTAVVKGADRLDVARGLGFVHAQERFFEMDLARRSAAGELSELFGPMALERDKTRRLHRMRAMLAARYADMDATDHALLQAYADGVNAGLAQLHARPWQYLMLRVEPKPWQPVDSLLVIGEMFWMLQGSSVDDGFERAQWQACVSPELIRWLEPRGGRWDGALDRSTTPPAGMPGPDWLDLRKREPASPTETAQTQTQTQTQTQSVGMQSGPEFLPDLAASDRHEPMIGSNNWAVSGARSAAGDAMLANDMHLGLNVPATWFRAQFEIGDGAAAIRAAGVTLPGVPALVVGTNGRVAWGFTNTYGQWFDWIEVPKDAGPDRITHATEAIAVKGAPSAALSIALFDGLPIAETQNAQAYALNWVADVGDAYNLKLDEMLTARDVVTAAGIAARSGIPEQNILIADSQGAIAWTIAGARFGSDLPDDERPDSPAPTSVARSSMPARRPRAATRPRRHRSSRTRRTASWTANARAYRGETGEPHDTPAPCARRCRPTAASTCAASSATAATTSAPARSRSATACRDAEVRREEPGRDPVRRRGEVPAPWAGRIAAIAASATARPEVTTLLKEWNGRADADQAGYRLVRDVRTRVLDALWAAWSAPLIEAGKCPARKFTWHARFEYAAEDALDKQPPHLLPRGFASWDAFLLAQVDATVAEMTRNGARPLAQATWGEENRSHIGHVLSRAVPALSCSSTCRRCRSRATATCRTWRRRRSASRNAWWSPGPRGTRHAGDARRPERPSHVALLRRRPRRLGRRPGDAVAGRGGAARTHFDALTAERRLRHIASARGQVRLVRADTCKVPPRFAGDLVREPPCRNPQRPRRPRRPALCLRPSGPPGAGWSGLPEPRHRVRRDPRTAGAMGDVRLAVADGGQHAAPCCWPSRCPCPSPPGCAGRGAA